MIRIGYQGEIGSNSEAAAGIFAKNLEIVEEQIIFLPLVTSKIVVEKLDRGEIDFGVMATRNSLAGVVDETKIALDNSDKELATVDSVKLPIHHCLFTKECKNIEDICLVASHIQALIQTKEKRKQICPKAVELELEDTALAARKLANGELPDNCAVICRKNAGEYYGLKLQYENIEDTSGNITEFNMYKEL